MHVCMYISTKHTYCKRFHNIYLLAFQINRKSIYAYSLCIKIKMWLSLINQNF